MQRPAVFLDKDGTVIVNVPYNVEPVRIELMPGIESLAALQRAGYRFVMISNQSGVAHGYFSEEALHDVWDRVGQLLKECGVDIDAFYYCPHHPEGQVDQYRVECECRKPKPGLIQRAAGELNIDLSRSWFLGDILDDVEAGNRAGCRTILVDVGSETKWHITADRLPDHHVTSISAAVDCILQARPRPVPRRRSRASPSTSSSAPRRRY